MKTNEQIKQEILRELPDYGLYTDEDVMDLAIKKTIEQIQQEISLQNEKRKMTRYHYCNKRDEVVDDECSAGCQQYEPRGCECGCCEHELE